MRSRRQPVVYKEDSDEADSVPGATSEDGSADEYKGTASADGAEQELVEAEEDRAIASDLVSTDSDDLDQEDGQKRRRSAQQGKRQSKGHVAQSSSTRVKVKEQRRDSSSSSQPYRDDRIHPNTLAFLDDLAHNNDREWFWTNEPIYRAALSDWKSFVDHLVPRMIEEVDDTLPMLPAKDLVHRIARDVRFSNDRTPFKRNLSFGFSRTGRKGPWAGWYVHIMPNDGSLVAAGLWQPEKNDLARIRHGIQHRPHMLRDVIANAQFIEHFGEPRPPPTPSKKPRGKRKLSQSGSDDEDHAETPSRSRSKRNGKQALKGKNGKAPSETTEDEEEFSPRHSIFGHRDMLKVAPLGITKDHPDIDLLRLRTIAVVKYISDASVLGSGFADDLIDIMKTQAPLVRTLNAYLAPDDPESGAEDED